MTMKIFYISFTLLPGAPCLLIYKFFSLLSMLDTCNNDIIVGTPCSSVVLDCLQLIFVSEHGGSWSRSGNQGQWQQCLTLSISETENQINKLVKIWKRASALKESWVQGVPTAKYSIFTISGTSFYSVCFYFCSTEKKTIHKCTKLDFCIYWIL